MPGIPENFGDILQKKAFAHLATVSATGRFVRTNIVKPPGCPPCMSW